MSFHPSKSRVNCREEILTRNPAIYDDVIFD